MNGTLANIVGLMGSAVLVFGYAYSNLAARVNFVLFNTANLVGAVLLGASLLVHWNLASFVLEIVWGGIALFGLGKAWLTRRGA